MNETTADECVLRYVSNLRWLKSIISESR
jgi:hypothetical protein